MTRAEESILLQEMSWPEVSARIADGCDRVLLPIGATEQHGPQLPLDVDSQHTWAVAQRVALRLGRTVLGPLLPVGCSAHHMAFPGTISIQATTLEVLVGDCCESLAQHGFRTILLFSGHGGNHAPLAEMLPRLQRRAERAKVLAYADPVAFMTGLALVAKRAGVAPAVAGWHAGEFETSLMLALAPHAVREEKIAPGYRSDDASVLTDVAARGIGSVASNGVLGDPSCSDAARGEEYLEGYVDLVTAALSSHLKGKG